MTVVTDFLTTSFYQAGFPLLILCVLLVVSVYVVAIFRDYAAEDREDTQKGIANLEEMHAKGDISEAIKISTNKNGRADMASPTA